MIVDGDKLRFIPTGTYILLQWSPMIVDGDDASCAPLR
jgi:hypothetical protein